MVKTLVRQVRGLLICLPRHFLNLNQKHMIRTRLKQETIESEMVRDLVWSKGYAEFRLIGMVDYWLYGVESSC